MNEKKLHSFILYFVSFIVFVTPLFFLPILANWFDFPKATFLLIGSLLVIVLSILRSLFTNKLPFVNSIFLLPTGLFALSSIISALLTDNKIASLVSDPVLYAGAFFLLLALTQILNKEETLNWLVYSLLASSAVLGVISVIQTTFWLLPFLPVSQTLRALSPDFSLTGSPLSQAVLLAIILPVALGFYFQSQNKTKLLIVAVVGAGLLTTVYFLYRQAPILLPQNVGWKIATGALGQSLASAFFGTGPGNFVDAFTLFKPVEFNASNFWNLRFSTSSNYYFHLLTTVGIIGLASFLFLVVKVIQMVRKRFEGGGATSLEKGLITSLVLALILFALLPAPGVALVVFFATLGILTGYFQIKENTSYVSVHENIFANYAWSKVSGTILALIILAFVAFFLGKFVLADYYFATSIMTAAKNQGTQTYNLQIKALSLNPYNDSYRNSYAQTNLALADALAAQPNLTDQQKQTVVALVQQAIRESRLAAGLGPKRAGNFENLSLVYRNLINFAQGADQWAIVSQNQAINLDPTNPRLRLDLGGIYFALKDYQSAAQAFALAVNLKPDFANAHYNLAQVLKQLNLKDQASQQLQLTATLVCATGQTPDCQRVNSEISGLAVPPPPASPGASLATPSAQTNLPKAQTKPPAKIASPSGELAQ